jgi:acyl carrier protein
VDGVEDQIKELIVASLGLVDVRPEDIATEAPLFGDGLGLDSIDALQLARAIETRYRVKVRPDDEANRAILFSVASLTRFIQQASSPERVDGR